MSTATTTVRAAVAAFAERSVRRRQAIELVAYSGGVTALVLLLSNWIVNTALSAPHSAYDYGPPIPWDTLALADVLSLMVLSIALIVVAPSVIAAHIGGERRAGTLDQLRTTPVSPLGLLAGFLVGPAIRIYLLCVGPLALHTVAMLAGRVPPTAFVESIVVLFCGTLFAATFGAALAMAPRRDSGGALLAVGTAALLGIWGFIAFLMSLNHNSSPWSFSHPMGALSSTMISFDGLWRRMTVSQWQLEHWNPGDTFAPLASTAWSLATAALLAHASVRRLGSPDRPTLGKLHAVALFTMFALAVIIPGWTDNHFSTSDSVAAIMVFGLVLIVPLVPIGLLSTPSVEMWSLGRRTKVGAFHDAAGPRGAMWLMLAIFAVLAIARVDSLRHIDGRQLAALGLTGWLAVTLPLYLLFAAVRYQTAGARAAFLVGMGAHAVLQIVTVGMTLSHYTTDVERLVRNIGLFAAVAVPMFVAWRLRVFARRAD
jgi:hypothetical protein